LNDSRKLARGNRTRSRCDRSAKEHRDWREDGFLLDDAHALGAALNLTKDPRLPRGVVSLPLRRGGRFRVRASDPEDI
jgi:hypothetical protein